VVDMVETADTIAIEEDSTVGVGRDLPCIEEEGVRVMISIERIIKS
jgi:hypothetical protein